MLDSIISLNNKFIVFFRVKFFTSIIKDISLFVTRFWIFAIYIKSALIKSKDWDRTFLIFSEHYNLPILGYILPAILSFIIEVFFSPFILLGLFSRFFIIPLLLMTLIIQLFIFSSVMHIYWILMMFFIIAYGSGKISLDYLLIRKTPIKHIG